MAAKNKAVKRYVPILLSWGVGRNAVVEIAARLMRNYPSVFFRMVARNSIILLENEEEEPHH